MQKKRHNRPEAVIVEGAAYGGHFRAIQGFRYTGNRIGQLLREYRN